MPRRALYFSICALRPVQLPVIVVVLDHHERPEKKAGYVGVAHM
jgi:hypothetical protein